jgi:hypothetical protein
LILLLAIIVGLLAGLVRAWAGGRRLAAPSLKLIWVIPLAFLPQFFAFQLPASRANFPDQWIPVALIGSQILLLFFAAINLRQPGMWLMGLGLLLNLSVITLNGGWMPISPDTVMRLAPNAPAGSWGIGERLGVTKDKVLPVSETQLWFLSDRFVVPNWTHTHIAFSMGDVLIALGAIWFFWSLGGPGEVT